MECVESSGVAESAPVRMNSEVPSLDGVARASLPVGTRSGVRAVNARPETGERPRTAAEVRAQSLSRYLSAQSDIDEEVLKLYKLVCRV